MGSAPAPGEAPATPAASQPKQPLPVKWWWIGAILMPVAIALLNWTLSSSKPKGDYITNIGTIKNEFVQVLGQTQADPVLIERIERAIELSKKGDYATAIALYRQLLEQAPLPSIYNNLGVLYASINDRERAQAAFAHALAKDPAYEAAIRNTAELRHIEEKQTSISGNEAEPNDSPRAANVMQIGTAVSGSIQPKDDIDSFQFKSEPKLRDWIRIELKNRSDKLDLAWRILDASRSPVHDWRGAASGADGSDEFVAAPASEYFIQVASQYNSTEGAYVLSVAPQRRFDRYEPNDNMQAATTISVGQTISANIMEPKDIDSYRFTSAPGTVTISLQNQSATLEPSVRVLDSLGAVVMDWAANSNPGGHLSPSVELKAAGTYYTEVGSHFNSTVGAYQLNIK